jgi:hypothetical protein
MVGKLLLVLLKEYKKDGWNIGKIKKLEGKEKRKINAAALPSDK